jgi:hypothetical protein
LYYDKLSGKYDYEFIISMNEDDPTMNNPEIQAFLDSKPNLSYFYGPIHGKIAAFNADLQNQDFSILIVAQDDMLPQVDGYDEMVVQEMLKHFPNLDGALHFNDGHTKAGLNTLPIMGKRLYEDFGYVFHPDYRSEFCDNEYHEVTYGMNKNVYIDQCIIEHRWLAHTGADQLYKFNLLFRKKDRATWVKRKYLGYPRASIFSEEFASVNVPLFYSPLLSLRRRVNDLLHLFGQLSSHLHLSSRGSRS